MKVSLDRKISINSTTNYQRKAQSPIFTQRLSADTVCFSSANVAKLQTNLNYTIKEQQALDLVNKLFEGKFRKDGVTPSANHSEFVGNKLKEAGYDEDVVAAGFLHDVVEDIPGWTHEKIKNQFGSKVSNLVKEVTHKDPNADWDTKLFNYTEKLKTISPEGMAIAACDKMSSLQDDVNSLKKYGDKAFDKLGASPRKQLNKHLYIYNIIMKAHPPNEPIAREYNQTITEYSSLTISTILDPRRFLKN